MLDHNNNHYAGLQKIKEGVLLGLDVQKIVFESISSTVTCTGELSALSCVIPRREGLNTPPV